MDEFERKQDSERLIQLKFSIKEKDKIIKQLEKIIKQLEKN